MNNENMNVTPDEGDVQNAIIEVASKKVNELTSSTIILEANLIACQKKLRLSFSSINDLKEELNNRDNSVKENYTEKVSELKNITDKLTKLTVDYETVKQENVDLKSKIDTGYKKQIRELREENKKLKEE